MKKIFMNNFNNNIPKLVRDRIPEIIAKNGRRPVTRVLNDTEFLQALVSKLHEEVCEVANEVGNKEAFTQELADVLEVVDALSALHNVSQEELFKVKREKRCERGGFDKRLWLEKIE